MEQKIHHVRFDPTADSNTVTRCGLSKPNMRTSHSIFDVTCIRCKVIWLQRFGKHVLEEAAKRTSKP